MVFLAVFLLLNTALEHLLIYTIFFIRLTNFGLLNRLLIGLLTQYRFLMSTDLINNTLSSYIDGHVVLLD